MSSIAYLQGRFIPLSDAKISVLDRGFLFGDGVYEVIPVYAGKLFRLRQHLDRLAASLEQTRIPLPLEEIALEQAMQRLIDENGGGDQSLYLQITRGYQPKRDHLCPHPPDPTLFMMTNPVEPIDIAMVEGIRAVTLPDNRWTRCNIKSICLLPNLLLKQQACAIGADDVILLRGDRVTEASAANVFIVKDQAVSTPPMSNLILGGITRDLILELLVRDGIDCNETEISEAHLRDADEIWLTSSTREIAPVIELDGVQVGTGKPGASWLEMMLRLQEYKQRLKDG